MKTYLINLDSRPDRLAVMERRLRQVGIEAERIRAVTPADLNPAMLEQHCDPKRRFYLTPAELSCSLSHLAAIQCFLDSGEAFSLVLEDDVVLSAELADFLDAFSKGPPDVDVLRLETELRPISVAPSADGRVGDVGICAFHSWCAGAAAYILSRRAAELVLASGEMLNKQTDRVLFNPYEPLAHALRIRLTDRAFALQEYLLKPDHQTGAASDLASSRSARDEVDNRWGGQRSLFQLLDFVDRDIRIASIKLWHQHVRGARKRVIPFAGALPSGSTS